MTERLGIQVRFAWCDFDASGLADRLARSARVFEESSAEEGGGHAALVSPVATVSWRWSSLASRRLWPTRAVTCTASSQRGGRRLDGRLIAANGCTGCDGPAGHDWQARMRIITGMQPEIAGWLERDVWTRAVNDTGYTVTRH